MFTLRPSEERGHFNFGWLDTRHSFSFGDYYDPAHMGFHSLRVINEDVIQPGEGFGTHPHRDMEILTWVLSGALQHQDSLGHVGIIRPGEAQRMSAGRGIRHSEFNASGETPVHLLQIWLSPNQMGVEPDYEQVAFPDEALKNRLTVVASPDGREGSASWHQDAILSIGRLDGGTSMTTELAPRRHAWIQVARGEVRLESETGHSPLKAGDGVAIQLEPELRIHALSDSEILLFDLP